jgi:hypothetical protein
MNTTFVRRLALATSCAITTFACAGQSDKIQSPDPHASKTPTSASSSEAVEPAAKDVASVCKEAKPVAALGIERSRTLAVVGRGDAAIGVLGWKPSEKYSLADLQALEKKEQYPELLGHIEDVPPASRGASWDALLTRVATSYVAGLAEEADTYAAFGGFMQTEHLVERYPQLRKSGDFMRRRGEVGQKMFTKCFQLTYSGEECVSMALQFVRVAGTDAKEKLAVAKVVSRNQNKYNAVPFFRVALTGEDRSACKDDDLAATMTAGLGLPPDYDNAKEARDIAQNVCFAELEKPIVEELTTGDGSGYFRDNACSVLREKGVVK